MVSSFNSSISEHKDDTEMMGRGWENEVGNELWVRLLMRRTGLLQNHLWLSGSEQFFLNTMLLVRISMPLTPGAKGITNSRITLLKLTLLSIPSQTQKYKPQFRDMCSLPSYREICWWVFAYFLFWKLSQYVSIWNSGVAITNIPQKFVALGAWVIAQW